MSDLKQIRAGLPDWPMWTIPLAILSIASFAVLGTTMFVILVLAVGRIAGTKVSLKGHGVHLGETLVMDLAFICGAAFAVWLAVRKLVPAEFGFVRVARKGQAVGLAALGWFVFIGATAAWKALLDSHEKQTLTEQLGVNRSAFLWAGGALLITVAAPLAEEFLFRGFVFTVLWKHAGLVVGVLGTGVLFGLLHAGSSPGALLVPLAVLGAILCLLRVVTGSLLPCIALHSVNNSIAFGVQEKLALGTALALIAVGLTATLTIGGIIVRRA
ncbi:MAG: type II CAAX endopeptidase family protein [Solirubrobacterales bacterium]|nr:type II CAAX endopeptidase family protein [Solirubrobacterales bacterium]